MLNYIWLGLVLLAVIIGGATDHLQEVGAASLNMARLAVMDVALPLVGVMALWLGIMRLAERSGLVTLMARALSPLMSWLFPDVPPDHPAMGSMLMNFAANMLGLNNASTPLGLRAMKDLESLNPRPGVATNAMCMFLAINTSSIQLIPATAIAILVANHARNPTAIVGTALMASACGAISAVIMAKFLARLPMFRLRTATIAGTPSAVTDADATSEKPVVKEALSLQPLQWWGQAVLAIYALLCLYVFIRLAFPAVLPFALAPHLPPTANASPSVFKRVVDAVSILSIPVLLSLFPLYAALRRVKVYEEFVDGAKEGFDVAIKIIPYLVAILVAVGMFRAAGGIDLLSQALGPLMSALHFPPDLLPMVLMRPLSGSGTLGLFTELVNHLGPDNLVVQMAGTIFGSSETTFYVLAVYFGSVGVKKARYSVIAGLTADFVSVIASVIVCRLVLG
jgi:spore maturation protein SpmA